MRAISRGIESRRSSSRATCSTSFTLNAHSRIGARKCSAWLPRKFIGPIDSKNTVAGAAMSRLTITAATRDMSSSSSVENAIDSGWVAKACRRPARISASIPAAFFLESSRISAGRIRETLNESHYMNGSEESQQNGRGHLRSYLGISLHQAFHVAKTERCNKSIAACPDTACPAKYRRDSDSLLLFTHGGRYDAVH